MKKNSFLKSSIIILLIVTLGKAIALVRDSLVASSFGMTDNNSIYAFALGATMLFISLGYGLTTSFIPIHSEVIENKDFQYRNKFVSNVINVSLLINIIIIIFGFIFAENIVKMAPTLAADDEILKSTVLLIRIMFISLIFVSIQSVVAGVLQSHHQFIEPAAMAIVSSLINIIYIVFFLDTYGLFGFGVATVIGFLGMLIINIPKFYKLGYRYTFYLDFKDKNLIKILKMIPSVVIFSSLVQINLFIIRGFGGSITTQAINILDYANKVNLIIYEIFAVAINMAVYPMLSQYVAQKDTEGYKNAFVKAFNMILLIMIPAAIGVFVLREEIITVYLRRGEFKQEDVYLVSSVLVYCVPSMIFFGLKDLLSRAFFSLQKSRVAMYNSILTIVFTIIFPYGLINFYNERGIALGSTVATILTTIIMLLQLNSQLNKIGLKRILIVFLKILVASSIMGIAVYFFKNLVIVQLGKTMLSNILALGISAFIGVVIYSIIALIMKIDEFIYIINILKNKFVKS